MNDLFPLQPEPLTPEDVELLRLRKKYNRVKKLYDNNPSVEYRVQKLEILCEISKLTQKMSDKNTKK